MRYNLLDPIAESSVECGGIVQLKDVPPANTSFSTSSFRVLAGNLIHHSRRHLLPYLHLGAFSVRFTVFVAIRLPGLSVVDVALAPIYPRTRHLLSHFLWGRWAG
jgi:hypothetical protein